MARGKGIVSLKDSIPDNEIVRNGEVRNAPNFIFPDGEYGITGKYRDYSLVKKNIAYRTGTEDDGINCLKVIEYTKWEDYPCYIADLSGIFNVYAKILNLSEFKTKKMMSEVSELSEIPKKTSAMINEALKGYSEALSKEQTDIVNLLDIREELLQSIEETKETQKKAQKEFEEFMEYIREKRAIIVKNVEPKKHRTKKEEE